MTNDDPPTQSESSPSQRQDRPARLHKALGVLTWAIFISSLLIDALPGYNVRPTLAALAVVTFLTFLGFGHIAGSLLNLTNTTRSQSQSNTQQTTQSDDPEDGSD